MFRDIRKNKTFSRRTVILGTGQAVLTGALVARLSYLQIFKHRHYSTQSDSNRIKPVINPAPRGEIFDRSKVLLTDNVKNFRLFFYLKRKRNIEELVENLGKILDLDDEEKNVFLAKIKNARRKNIISLKDNLGWDDVARIETNSYLLPGISIEAGLMRQYPYPFETAHTLGYVSLPAEKEVDENEQNLFLHPDFRIGKTGIEKTFDESLRGKYGVKYVEVDVHDAPLRTLSSKRSQEGSKINLTIDIRLQQFVTQRIQDVVASVVVMNVNSGEILAKASSPSFNPNNFVEGVSRKYWQELYLDKRKPLNDKTISATYPPGSTFKLMVALAALEAGVSPKQKVFCNGSYRLGRRVFHCWKDHGHGSVNLTNAIAQSCNTYFFTIANQIGYEGFTQMAKKFGYGQKLDISLFGASEGIVPSDQWKRRFLKEEWVGGDTLNTAIGQGFTLATPLQMALVTARIANGGVPIKPYLVKNHNIISQYDDLKNEPLANQNHLNIVKEAMRQAVNEEGGTAYGKRLGIKGYQMAGKTGTSQVISKRERHMSKQEIHDSSNHGLFVGFAPFHDPKYAISVVVEHGKSGSLSAAPIAKDVMLKINSLNL